MSRYHTLYSSTGTAKFQTLVTGAGQVRSAAIDARRITITTSNIPHYVAFGTSTVVATTSSAVIPANCVLDFNFVPGQYVSAIGYAAGAGTITIIDSD